MQTLQTYYTANDVVVDEFGRYHSLRHRFADVDSAVRWARPRAEGSTEGKWYLQKCELTAYAHSPRLRERLTAIVTVERDGAYHERRQPPHWSETLLERDELTFLDRVAPAAA